MCLPGLLVSRDHALGVDAVALELAHALDQVERIAQILGRSSGNDGFDQSFGECLVAVVRKMRVGERQPRARVARLFQ